MRADEVQVFFHVGYGHLGLGLADELEEAVVELHAFAWSEDLLVVLEELRGLDLQLRGFQVSILVFLLWSLWLREGQSVLVLGLPLRYVLVLMFLHIVRIGVWLVSSQVQDGFLLFVFVGLRALFEVALDLQLVLVFVPFATLLF